MPIVHKIHMQEEIPVNGLLISDGSVGSADMADGPSAHMIYSQDVIPSNEGLVSGGVEYNAGMGNGPSVIDGMHTQDVMQSNGGLVSDGPESNTDTDSKHSGHDQMPVEDTVVDQLPLDEMRLARENKDGDKEKIPNARGCDVCIVDYDASSGMYTVEVVPRL